MRILDQNNNKSVKKILLCLTLEEAKELKDSLSDLIKQKNNVHHEHVDDLDYSHEITVTIYDDNNTHLFDERTQKLIKIDN